jgi:hypothetical protein
LKLSRGLVRGRLGQDGGRKLERGGQGWNEEEGQFRFHTLMIITQPRLKVAAAREKWSLVISIRQA